MDYSYESRYGILPKHSSSENDIIWFNLPTHYVFHYGNAWEEVDSNGDKIIKSFGFKYD